MARYGRLYEDAGKLYGAWVDFQRAACYDRDAERIRKGGRDMDQTMTGALIKALRLEKGWTQRELAERLEVSEKTVSKWETGRGFPEVALMMPLCALFSISVNELLSGKRIADEAYRKQAEETMLDLACDRTPPRVKVAATAVACTLQLLVVLTLVLLAGFLGLPVWARLRLIGAALCSFAAVLVPVLLVAVNTERFTCPHCGKVFVPTLRAYVFGLHTLRRRRLKCPHCGKKGWCVSRLPRQ